MRLGVDLDATFVREGVGLPLLVFTVLTVDAVQRRNRSVGCGLRGLDEIAGLIEDVREQFVVQTIRITAGLDRLDRLASASDPITQTILLANARPIHAFPTHRVGDPRLIVVETDRRPTDRTERRLQLFEEFDFGDDTKPPRGALDGIPGRAVFHEIVRRDRHHQDLVPHFRFDGSDLESDVERHVGHGDGRVVGTDHRPDGLDPRSDAVSKEGRLDLERRESDVVPRLASHVDHRVDRDGLVHRRSRDGRGRSSVGDRVEPVSDRVEILESEFITENDLEVAAAIKSGGKPPPRGVRGIHVEHDRGCSGNGDGSSEELRIDRAGRGPFDGDRAFEHEIELQVGALEHRLAQSRAAVRTGPEFRSNLSTARRIRRGTDHRGRGSNRRRREDPDRTNRGLVVVGLERVLDLVRIGVDDPFEPTRLLSREHETLPVARFPVADAADPEEDAVGRRIAANQVRGHRERLPAGMHEVGLDPVDDFGPRRPLRIGPGCEHAAAGDRRVRGSPGDECDGHDADHHRRAEQPVGERRIDDILESNGRDPGPKIANRPCGERVSVARSARFEFDAARQSPDERWCDPFDAQCDVDQRRMEPERRPESSTQRPADRHETRDENHPAERGRKPEDPVRKGHDDDGCHHHGDDRRSVAFDHGSTHRAADLLDPRDDFVGQGHRSGGFHSCQRRNRRVRFTIRRGGTKRTAHVGSGPGSGVLVGPSIQSSRVRRRPTHSMVASERSMMKKNGEVQIRSRIGCSVTIARRGRASWIRSSTAPSPSSA